MASYLKWKKSAIGIFKWNRVFSISKWVVGKKKVIFKTRFTHRYSHPVIVFWNSHGAESLECRRCDFCRLRASAVTWIKEGLLRLKLCNLVVCNCWPIGPACGAIDTPGSTGSNEFVRKLDRKLDRKLEWPLLDIGRTEGVRLKMGTPHSSIWAMEPLACGAVDSTSSSASCNLKKIKYS